MCSIKNTNAEVYRVFIHDTDSIVAKTKGVFLLTKSLSKYFLSKPSFNEGDSLRADINNHAEFVVHDLQSSLIVECSIDMSYSELFHRYSEKLGGGSKMFDPRSNFLDQAFTDIINELELISAANIYSSLVSISDRYWDIRVLEKKPIGSVDYYNSQVEVTIEVLSNSNINEVNEVLDIMGVVFNSKQTNPSDELDKQLNDFFNQSEGTDTKKEYSIRIYNYQSDNVEALSYSNPKTGEVLTRIESLLHLQPSYIFKIKKGVSKARISGSFDSGPWFFKSNPYPTWLNNPKDFFQFDPLRTRRGLDGAFSFSKLPQFHSLGRFKFYLNGPLEILDNTEVIYSKEWKFRRPFRNIPIYSELETLPKFGRYQVDFYSQPEDCFYEDLVQSRSRGLIMVGTGERHNAVRFWALFDSSGKITDVRNNGQVTESFFESVKSETLKKARVFAANIEPGLKNGSNTQFAAIIPIFIPVKEIQSSDLE